MFGFRPGAVPFAAASLLALTLTPVRSKAQDEPGRWSFAVSGDSRNCGDFVMPAIAAKVKGERDAFYWHLGDFRWISEPDEDLVAMDHGGNPFTREAYLKIAWDDFLVHQIASFSPVPVFLGRGNHENVRPMTREGYVNSEISSIGRRLKLSARQTALAPPRLAP